MLDPVERKQPAVIGQPVGAKRREFERGVNVVEQRGSETAFQGGEHVFDRVRWAADGTHLSSQDRLQI